MTNEELKEKGIKLSNQISDLVNYGGDGKKVFIEEMIKGMGNDHRTLQQSFTRMCLEWLERTSQLEGNQIDPRNQASQQTAERLMKGFVKVIAEENKISENEVLANWDVYKPSKWLPLV